MKLFKIAQIYHDRLSRPYIFYEQVGGVTKFYDITQKPTCRNIDGNYRWDDKQTDEDIVNA